VKFWIYAAIVTTLATASVIVLSAQETAKEYQIATPRESITISALNIQTEKSGLVVKATGKVEIRSKTMVVTANEADYNINTAEIALHGPVNIKLAK
jgi:lipopolysaccharide assembly outer membrane protein LptD (OstA)